MSLPAATNIGNGAFGSCPALHTVDLPAATSIGRNAFASTGGTVALTVTLPAAAPQVATTGVPVNESYTKTVTVKAPADRTGYDTTWEENFKKVFGGSGNTVTINLTVETE